MRFRDLFKKKEPDARMSPVLDLTMDELIEHTVTLEALVVSKNGVFDPERNNLYYSIVSPSSNVKDAVRLINGTYRDEILNYDTYLPFLFHVHDNHTVDKVKQVTLLARVIRRIYKTHYHDDNEIIRTNFILFHNLIATLLKLYEDDPTNGK